MTERILKTLWTVAILLLLGLFASGCDAVTGSDDDDDKGSGSGADYFTVVIDGESTTYTETEADNDFGYDPYIVSWYDTVEGQTHAFVASGIGDTVDLIVAITVEPYDATGTDAVLHEVRYERGWDFASDPENIDDVNGTIDVEESAAEVGDEFSGAFTGFTAFTPGDGTVDTMEGEFDATREADDLF